jgi:hypothetical protein
MPPDECPRTSCPNLARKPSSADRLADRKNLLLKISIKVLVYTSAVPA